MSLPQRVVILLALHCAGLGAAAHAQDTPASGVLFENVRIFNGKDGALSPLGSVLTPEAFRTS